MRPSEFPCWRGYCGNGHVAPAAWPLLRTPDRVKLAWASEAQGIGVGWGTRSGPSGHGRDQAQGPGFAGSTVAGGRAEPA
jgi:hypothetical protein